MLPAKAFTFVRGIRVLQGPRGHQFPAAFLIKAAGLSNDGVGQKMSDQRYRFTHLDIGGSGVEGGDWQHGRPTAAPVLGLMATLCGWSHD